MKHKVLAYITRRRNGRTQLLVFTHRDFPEAGVQVPAGTVEPDEPVEAALFREVHEESGLTPEQVRLVAQVAEFADQAWGTVRHVFHLDADDLPEAWAHTVHGTGEDAGMVFNYYWVSLGQGLELAGAQGRFLDRLDGGQGHDDAHHRH